MSSDLASAAPSASPLAPSRSIWRRRIFAVLRGFLLFSLLLVVTAFAVTHVTAPNPHSAGLVIRLLLALGFLAGPVWAVVRTLRRRSLRGWPCAALAASLALFATWLVHDETVIRHDRRHPALSSDFPNAAASHALVLRYAQNVPASLHDTVRPISLRFPSQASTTEWIAFVRANREAIEASWAELAAPRAWFDEMSAQPALADLCEDFDDPIPGFAPIRAIVQTATAHATLLALDGRAEEAIAELLPVLDVGQKLEAHSRTLVSRMIATVMRRSALRTLTIVLDQAALAPATRDRLVGILQTAQEAETGARLLMLGEHYLFAGNMRQLYAAKLAKAYTVPYAPLFSPVLTLFYNPVATINLHGDLFHRLADLAAQRDIAGMEAALARATMQPDTLAYWSRKNLGGYILLGMATPSFDKVVANYWETQDLHTALLARLTSPTAAAVSFGNPSDHRTELLAAHPRHAIAAASSTP